MAGQGVSQSAVERGLPLKILIVGDVVGRPGRSAVQAMVPRLRDEWQVDFVIANGENAAAGWGITQRTADELLSAGVDCLTSGNHIWANREGPALLDSHPQLLRPANFAPGAPGRGSGVYETAAGARVGVINLIGRTFMDPADCPFRRGDDELRRLSEAADVVIVDFHAEATSEKQALGYHFDGRVTAVVGTHTHVQTADETLLPAGTAFITDVGMTGPMGTVIGVDRRIVVRRFVSGLPQRFEVPKHGPSQLNAVLVEAGLDKTGAKGIQRVAMPVST
jgi:2',3'-cyclic-nucleotide 2'-phosphodiesterase